MERSLRLRQPQRLIARFCDARHVTKGNPKPVKKSPPLRRLPEATRYAGGVTGFYPDDIFKKTYLPAEENPPVLRKYSATRLKYLRQSYVPQINRYACSAASVAMIINAIYRGRHTAQGHLWQVTQQELLTHIDVVHWRDRLSARGYHGRFGVTIVDLKIICEAALNTYEIPYETVELFQVDETMRDLNVKKGHALRQLTQMSTSEKEFILAYFTQGELVGDWFGSHVSPVGAFDRTRQTVMVLDVDPEVHEPYQVSFDQFFTSLVGRNNTYNHRGGGWVHIRIES